MREALGQNWLKELEGGKYFGETYICHLELRIDDLAAILTETRVLVIHTKKHKLEYDAKFSEVRKIESFNSEICLFLKHSEQEQWVIPCPDPSVTEVCSINVQWLRKQVDDAYWNYIQNSRPYE